MRRSSHQWYEVVRDHRYGKRRLEPVREEVDNQSKEQDFFKPKWSRSYKEVLEVKVNDQKDSYAKRNQGRGQEDNDQINRFTGFNQSQRSELNMKNRLRKTNYVSILIHNLPQHASTRDIWLYFNKDRWVRDIILPRKRDKNNFRIGFLIVQLKDHTQNIINKLSGTYFLGNKLLLKLSAFHSDSHINSQHNIGSATNIGSQLSKGIAVNNRGTKVNQVVINHDKINEDHLQKQPSFRTINGKVNIETREVLSRSLIGITETAEWADMIQEKIRTMGLYYVSVKGISHHKFLVTFNDSEDKAQSRTVLD